MEVGSQEWIEGSLARLETLEAERAQHEQAIETVDDPAQLKRHTDALDRLDREIKALYAQLEAVAGEDEDSEDTPQEARETIGDEERSAPHAAAAPSSAFAAAAASLASPPAAPVSAPMGSGGFGSSVSVDDDIKPAGGAGKWVFLGLVLLAGIGTGGFFLWQNMQKEKPAEKAPAEPEQVIKASTVPDDTEEPNAAKGGDATKSPTADGESGGGGGDTKGSKKDPKKEKKEKPIKLGGEDGDPLG